MSTFNCLGFHLGSEQSFRILIERALRFGRVVRPVVPAGAALPEGDHLPEARNDVEDDMESDAPTHCVLWELAGGVEAWVLRDADDNVVGCNPHLRSELECPITMMPESTDIALVECDSFRVHAEVPNVPFARDARSANLCMFVRDLAKSDPGTVELTAASGDDPLLVRFHGPIENALMATNADTQSSFGVLTLLLGGTTKLRLAVDLERTKDLPLEGWIKGTGYLSAAVATSPKSPQ